MKCSVCGNENGSAAGFCASCGATLRSAARIAPASPAPDAPAAPVPAGAVTALPLPVVRAVALILLASAFGVAVYFTYRALITVGPSETAVADEAARAPVAEVMESPRPAADGPAKIDAAAPQPAPAGDASKAMLPPAEPPNAAAPVLPSAADSATAPPTTPATVAPEAETAKARATAPRPARPAPSKGSTKATTAQQAPSAAGPAAAAAPEAPRPDRWAMMKEELGRCASENILARVACEQQTGIRYCEGYWGKVPQCPAVQQNPDK